MSVITLLSKPLNIPTRECECPYCGGDGWIEGSPSIVDYHGRYTRENCDECEGTGTGEEDCAFIVYDNVNQTYIGWIDDTGLPSGVSYGEASKYPNWDDACEDVSEYVNRYSLKVSDLNFIVTVFK